MTADVLLADVVQQRDLNADQIAEAYKSRAWVALGYESWDAYCRLHLRPRLGMLSPTARASAPAHVYLIQSGADGPIKIGAASDVVARLAQLQTGNPHPLRLLAVQQDGGKRAERALHEQHAEDHIHGEWFRPSPAVLATAEALRGGNA